MKSAPQAPTPPNPTVVAAAQGAANDQTARLQQTLNNVNSNSPYGQVTYSQDQSNPDRWTQNTTLSPAEQAIFNQQTSAQSGALGIANTQLNRVGGALGQGVTPAGLQSAVGKGPTVSSFDPGQSVQGSIGQTPVQYGFDQGQAVQGQVGPQNFNQSVQSARDAAYGQATSRLDPQWSQASEQQNAQLIAQGLNPNDAAWQNSETLFNNAKNDAYQQAQYGANAAGNAEQEALFGEDVSQGQFANSAAGQQFGQGLSAEQAFNAASGQQFSQGASAGTFANAAAGQQYGQNQGEAAFGNTAQNQQFGQEMQNAQLANTAAGQQFQENSYAQELPINEFNALMSSGQVQGPQGVQYTPTSVAPTDVTGAYALNSQAQQANYQAQMANYQSGLGGLFSLGKAAIGAFG